MIFVKTLAKENQFHKLEKSQPQIENPDYTENKILIDEMKQNMWTLKSNSYWHERNALLKSLKWKR